MRDEPGEHAVRTVLAVNLKAARARRGISLSELARLSAEQALGGQPTLLGNRVLLAHQGTPLDPITL